MAWNEPGNGDKDPWKNKGGKEQGPPDLDDLLKDLGNKMGGIFGGGKSSGASKNSGNAGSAFALLLFLIAIVVYAYSCIFTIKEAERGVKLRFGEYVDVVEPGLSWKWTFIERIIPIDMQTTRDLPASGFMLTMDMNAVHVEMEVQYRVINARDYVFSVTDPDKSLSQAFDSALRYVVGHSKMDDVLTSGKEIIRQAVSVELNKIIEPYNLGLLVVDVNFKNARPPEEVKDAFDDAIAAEEDEDRYIKEAEAYALSIEPRARGRVKRLEQEALAYKEQTVLDAEGSVAKFEKLLPEYKAAPEVTRQRLYLATMEKVYSNTSKVMVDVEGGNNMMYLPLDKIINQQPQSPRAVQQSMPVNNTQSQPTRMNPSSVGRSDRFSGGRN